MQFLILHKVRGEPSLDIAEKAQIGDEEGWVLCTCGHRAYPYKVLASLSELCYEYFPGGCEIPEDWPEHYRQHAEPKLKINVLEVVSRMLPKIKRRL